MSSVSVHPSILLTREPDEDQGISLFGLSAGSHTCKQLRLSPVPASPTPGVACPGLGLFCLLHTLGTATQWRAPSPRGASVRALDSDSPGLPPGGRGPTGLPVCRPRQLRSRHLQRLVTGWRWWGSPPAAGAPTLSAGAACTVCLLLSGPSGLPAAKAAPQGGTRRG